jgi:hypothetical protein
MLNNFSATLNIKCPLFSSCSKVMVPDGNGLNDGMLFYGAGTTQKGSARLTIVLRSAQGPVGQWGGGIFLPKSFLRWVFAYVVQF